MAKFYNNRVKSGKLAGSVFSVRNGETIERAYQPVVLNPKTPGQVASRARLKMMSQLSAVMAPVIAMSRVGMVSPRNRFVQTNYGRTSFAESKASVDLLGIQITKSVIALPVLQATRNGNKISLSLIYAMQEGISRMVYAAFVKQTNNTLRYLTSAVVSEAGAAGTYPTEITLDAPNLDVIVYGYGVRDNTQAARVAFGNLTAPSATTIAELVTSRTLTDADITLTETRAIESAPSE